MFKLPFANLERKVIILFVVALASVLIYFWVSEVFSHGKTKQVLQQTQTTLDKTRDTLYHVRGNVTAWKNYSRTLENKAQAALSQVGSLKQQLSDAFMKAGEQLGLISRKDLQITALTKLRKNKTITPAQYDKLIVQTGPGFSADSVYDRGVAETATRLELFERQYDSVMNVATTATGQVDTYKKRADRAESGERETSLLAEDKLLKLAAPKPIFSKSRRRQAREYAAEIRRKREAQKKTHNPPSAPDEVNLPTLEGELNKPKSD